VAVRPAALVSDEKCIRGMYAKCAIQIDTFTFTCQRGVSFSAPFQIVDFKGKFLRVDKTLGADITVKILRKLCSFRKMES